MGGKMYRKIQYRSAWENWSGVYVGWVRVGHSEGLRMSFMRKMERYSSARRV